MKTAAATLTLLATLAALDATAAREMVAGSITGTVSSYTIDKPDIGSCRLQGIAASSDNFKNYASVSGKDATLNDGCARCIKVTRDDDTSKAVTAYVLDVAQGTNSGALRLSQAALTTLAVDVNSNNVSVTYKYINCPSSLASGNVKACLMEGASNAYIPLQFYNSQKVIASAKINGVEAKSTKDSYLFSATSGQSKEGTSAWFESVAVELTSYDNETLSGTFAFGAASGCATYTTQFSAASTADGTDISRKASSSGGDGALLPALLGGVGALLVVIGSVFVIRRRRVARAGVQTPNNNHSNDDVENQYLTPKGKPSPAGPTYASDHSGATGPHDPEPRSPTIDYAQSFSPAASFGAVAGTTSAAAAGAVDSPAHDQHSLSSGSSSSYSYNKPPTYSFSSNVSTSPRRPKTQTVATFSAPVVPTYSNAPPRAVAPPAPVVASAAAAAYEHPGRDSFSDESEQHDRSSFDIDDMRSTEEMKSMDRSSAALSSGRNTYGYAPEYANAAPTSPQSYVRATSLRRNTSGRAPSGVYRSNSSATAADAYDAGAPYAPGSSFREPSSGYSRDSLNILGYPYAKKSGRNSSVTGQ